MKWGWMRAMTFCVIAFYSFLFVWNLTAPKKPDSAASGIETRLSSEQLQQKEDIVRGKLEQNPMLLSALSLLFFGVVVSGIFLDARLIWWHWRGRTWPVEPEPAAEAGWRSRDVWQALVFLLFVEGCLFLARVGWGFIRGGHSGEGAPLLLLGTLFRNICVAAFVWVLIQKRYGQGIRELGLHFQKLFSHLRTGVLGYVAMMPAFLVLLLSMAAIIQFFSYKPEPQGVVQIYLKESSTPFLVAFTFFVALAGPVLEEIFFRGFAYAGFKKSFGAYGGACLSSAVFAALHIHWVAFFPIFFLGLFLTYLYEISGSLVPSITAHTLHNVIMVTLTLGFRSLSS